MVKKIITIILIALICTSCGFQKPQEVHDYFEDTTKVAETKVALEFTQAFETEIIQTTENENPSLSEAVIDENGYTDIPEWFPYSPPEGKNHSYTFLHGEVELRLYYFSEELIDFVGRERFDNWQSKFKSKDDIYEYWDSEFGAYDFYTSLTLSPNLYTFLVDFDIETYKMIELFENEKKEWIERVERELESADYRPEYSPVPGLENYFFTQQQIEALISRSEEDILNLFTGDNLIIKGINYYTPGWFFHNSIEEYRDVGITYDEIVKMVKAYRNSYRIFPESIDYFEYKATNYLLSIEIPFQVSDLFEYDKDIDMPFPYKRSVLGTGVYKLYDPGSYTLGRYEEYWIKKHDEYYEPYWVYYNKPTAYREADITPDELIEMLPKYKSLGILSDEAYKALEEKIYAYAESA